MCIAGMNISVKFLNCLEPTITRDFSIEPLDINDEVKNSIKKNYKSGTFGIGIQAEMLKSWLKRGGHYTNPIMQ